MSAREPAKCRCIQLRPQSHIEPAEWEQADDCPVHPLPTTDSAYVPSEAEVEAARVAYWPAYSEAVRNAPSNRNGQGITSADGEAAGRVGMAAAIAAAHTVARTERTCKFCPSTDDVRWDGMAGGAWRCRAHKVPGSEDAAPTPREDVAEEWAVAHAQGLLQGFADREKAEEKAKEIRDQYRGNHRRERFPVRVMHRVVTKWIDVESTTPAPPTDMVPAAALADTWDEGAETTSEWMWNNPGPSGIPSDPPANPYKAARTASTTDGDPS